MKSASEHCGFKLVDIDYHERVVLLEKNDGTEQVKFTFEFFQDVAKYTTSEWVWQKKQP